MRRQGFLIIPAAKEDEVVGRAHIKFCSAAAFVSKHPMSLRQSL